MPIVGRGAGSQLVLFHQGSFPGALSLGMILPKTSTVVASNSLALSDVPDWVGQLVLEELLNVPPTERTNLVRAAKDSIAETPKWYPRLLKELGDEQQNGTLPRNLQEYVGTLLGRCRHLQDCRVAGRWGFVLGDPRASVGEASPQALSGRNFHVASASH